MQIATEEYAQALRKGQKEYRERITAGLQPHPAVLDEILPETAGYTVQDIGLLEIPAERIIGVKSAGRITAFTANFLPLLESKSEFAIKWISLCNAHLGDTGIQEPILCYEYLGNFYVQEGNKRVSVLRYFDAPRIPSNVRRVLPHQSEDPRIRAYYEFLEFFKGSRLYAVQFRRPGDYAKLLTHLGKKMGEKWTEEERRTFNSHFHYFREAFEELNKTREDILPEEALLLWLELYAMEDLRNFTGARLRKTLSALWEDVISTHKQDSVKVQTRAEDTGKAGLLDRLLTSVSYEKLSVAFVHQLSPDTSTWAMEHEEGRRHIEAVFGDRITTRSYYNANSPEEAEAAISQAVEDGAQVVFTTAPPLSRATLRAAVEHPKVRFLNCSVDQAYSSIRTYYGRIFEGKFITGAIAGAMANNDRIGYITAYPLMGVPASVNAFALGARMTNPRAEIELRWTCLPGDPQADFFADGIRVVSNRSLPTQTVMHQDFCNYGTYLMEDTGSLIPLASPVWVWGKFYEFVIRNVMMGGWKNDKNDATALNYWLGMDSGIIELNFSQKLPEGVRQLAKILRRGVIDGTIDPFARRIVAQDGTVKNDGSRGFTPEELIRMDWLCDNVIGSIPAYEDLLPMAQPLVRELGVYRDKIPTEKEAKPREDFDRVR